MSLDTATYKADLQAAYTATQIGNGDPADALDAFLNAIVTATENFVKSAAIVYVDGLAAPGGPVTGAFNGNLE